MAKSCRMRALLLLLFGFTGAELCAAELPVPVAGSFRELTQPLDMRSRKAWIDQALAQPRLATAQAAESTQARLSPGNWTDVLKRVDVEGISHAADEPLEFFVNPEPSAMLVWGASIMGLMASGYGYRRRNSALPSAA